MAMENEDSGETLQEFSHDEDRPSEDHGSFEPLSSTGYARNSLNRNAFSRNAFSRGVSRTSKQPWYEPYLREIRRTH